MSTNWRKNTALFLIGQMVSLFGSGLVQYAIMWYITLETQSGVMMTIYIVAGFIPTFFISPVSGVLADRYDRKKLIVIADSFIAIATLILAVLFRAGYGSIWLLFLISAIRAIGSGIHSPAIGAVIPQLVPEDALTRVNGLNNSLQSFVFLISPMAAAALLSSFDLQYIFFIDVFTALIGISILIFAVTIPKHQRAVETVQESFFKDFKDGIGYISGHPYLREFFLFCIIFFFLISPLAFLTPLQVVRSYGDEVWRLSVVEIGFSAGMILGGMIIAAWGGFKNKVHTMALSTIMTGISTIVIGVKPAFAIYVLMIVMCGITMPFFGTPATVLIQRKVDPNYLGRVFSVYGMIHSSTMPLGMLIFGPLADKLEIEIMLLATGILMSGMTLFLLKSKEMLKAGE